MIKFDINEYQKNMNNELFKYLHIDTLDQPIIQSIKLLENAPHSISICWSIDDTILKTLKMKKPSGKSSKFKV